MIQDILKRLGHVPSSVLAAAVLILWCALVYADKLHADGMASMALLGAALGSLFYKPNEPKDSANV
jgi:hypothetical protein